MIELTADNWKLWLEPSYGAALLGLQWRDLWVMPDRRLADRSPVKSFEERSPYPEASFLLVPWSNRIRSGVLRLEDKEYQLERPEEHSLHGEAWNKPWKLIERTERNLILSFERPKSSLFPINYLAEYQIEIKEDVLSQKLTITNPSSLFFYLGLGFHPYFNKSQKTNIKVRGAFQYPMGNETGLPIGAASANELTEKLTEGLSLTDQLELDDCFKISEKNAEIHWNDLNKKIALSFFGDVSHLVIYNPKDPFFAVEPVSHANNAFGDFEMTEKKLIPPGGSLSIGYQISMQDLF